MPSLMESAVAPSTGADRARMQTFLDFLAGRLSADDYSTAVSLLWASLDPVFAAKLNQE